MNTKRFIAAIGLFVCLPGAVRPGRATETENQNLQILPAPGKVTVDGRVDDWDLTGGIFACGDVEKQRDQYATWFYAMYDKENLYLLARWVDHTPLNNPGSTLGDFGWQGDCLQVRVITRPGTPQSVESNLTCWKGVNGRDVVDVSSPRFPSVNPQGVDVKPMGAQQAFTVNPDNSGYVQEIAIPWKLLGGDNYAPVAGDTVSLTVEPNFTAGSAGRLSNKDIFKPGLQIDRVFTFRNWPEWGIGTLEAQGHVQVRPVRLSDKRTFPVSLHGTDENIDWNGLIKATEVQGFIPIRFTVPADGYISLDIRNADGVPVCQFLNQQFYTKGTHEVMWDGLSTPRFHSPGRVVPAGHYTWDTLYNPGLDLKLRGWASSSGSAPWDGGPTSGWGGEGPPDAVATDGTSMYLGWSGSEAGKAVFATDQDGNVHWRHKRGGFGGAQFVAVDNGIVYVLDPNDEAIYLLNAKDGTYHSWAGTPNSDIEVAKIWGAETAMPDHIEGMDVRDKVLYVSSAHPPLGLREVSDWMKLLTILRDGAAAGDPFQKAVWDKVDGDTQGRIENALKQNKPALLNGQAYVNEDAREIVARILARSPRPAVEAAYPGLIAHMRTNFIAAIDCTTGKVLKIVDTDSPTRLKAIGDNRILFISSGKAVCSLDMRTGKIDTIVGDLPGASDLAVGPDGTIYASLANPTNQVWVYNAAGHLLRSIGREGGRRLLGPWQPDGMYAIAGICLDARGHLWVTEEDITPKRISVWDTTSGKLVREYFGATHYGASGGAIDPRDPNIMVGEGCEWVLDPTTGHARCTGVFDRDNLAFLGGDSFARFAEGSNGRQYLLALCGADFLKIFERVGEGDYVLRGTVQSDLKTHQTTFWSDRNGDGQVQPDETQIYPGRMAFGGYYGWSLYANTDLTLYPETGTDTSVQLKVSGFTPGGAPEYDLKNLVKLPFGGGVPSLDNTKVLTENWPMGEFEAYDVATGKQLWSYPSQFIGVHGSHNAPPPAVGMIRGAFGVVGSAQVPGLGNIWAINSNVGEWHVLGADGFYVSRLFQGDLFKISFPDPAVPGADMDNTPPGLGGEDFGGSLVQAKDGKLYVQAGKTALWNLSLVGTDSVKRSPGGDITLTDADLAKSTAFREAALQNFAGPHKYVVKFASPQFTGNVAVDFKDADIVTYQKSEESLTHSAAAWDDKNLYLAWDVRDNTPWSNAATDPAQMYISGDTVDFQLASNPNADPKRNEAVAGDLRLSIGNFQGTPTAMLYRRVSTTRQPKVFSSGVVHAYPMDYVAPIADAVIKVKVEPGHGYTVEATVPLADLGIAPTGGLGLHGDFGVTFGDPAGQRTRLRSYWASQHTGIVDDAVYELMMEPEYWGDLTFAK